MTNTIYKGIKISSGFTLLELLVSITILSLIITISYSALRLGTKSWDVSIRNINSNADKRSAVELIKNKIEHAYPIYWKVDTRQVLAFKGDEQSLQFIAPSPQGRELGEYFEYLLVIDKKLTNKSLVLYFEPHDPGSDGFAVNRNSPSRQILSHLREAKFVYFGSPEVNSEEDWMAEWSNDFKSFPTAIQVVLTGSDKTNINVDMIVQFQSELYQI